MPNPNHPKAKSVEPSTKASDTEKTDITLEQIRQAGICNYYDKLKQKGLIEFRGSKKAGGYYSIGSTKKIKPE